VEVGRETPGVPGHDGALLAMNLSSISGPGPSPSSAASASIAVVTI
jgi:hypothetical protein